MSLVDYLNEAELPQIVKNVTSRYSGILTHVPVGERPGMKACTYYQAAITSHTEVCTYSHHPWHSASDVDLTGWRVHPSWQLWALRYSGPKSALFLVVIENPADDFILGVVKEIWKELDELLEARKAERAKRREEEAAKQKAAEESKRFQRLQNIQREVKKVLEGMSEQIKLFSNAAVEKEYAELSEDIHNRFQKSLGIETKPISWASITRSPSAVVENANVAKCVVKIVKILWNTYQVVKQKRNKKMSKAKSREADVVQLVEELKPLKNAPRDAALLCFASLGADPAPSSSAAAVDHVTSAASPNEIGPLVAGKTSNVANIERAPPLPVRATVPENNVDVDDWECIGEKKKVGKLASVRANNSASVIIADVFSRIIDMPTREPVGERKDVIACTHFQANRDHTGDCTFSHHPAHSASNCDLEGWKAHRLWQLWALRYAKPESNLFATVFRNPADYFVREVIDEINKGIQGMEGAAAAAIEPKAGALRSALMNNPETEAKVAALLNDPSLPRAILKVCSKLMDVPTEKPDNERIGSAPCFHFQNGDVIHYDQCDFSHHPWHSRLNPDLPGWRTHRTWQLWALRYADPSSALFYTVILHPADKDILNDIKDNLQKEIQHDDFEHSLHLGDSSSSSASSSSSSSTSHSAISEIPNPPFINDAQIPSPPPVAAASVAVPAAVFAPPVAVAPSAEFPAVPMFSAPNPISEGRQTERYGFMNSTNLAAASCAAVTNVGLDDENKSLTNWLSSRCPSVVVESYAHELEEQGYETADMLPDKLVEEAEFADVLTDANIVKLPHRRFLLQVWRHKLDPSSFAVPPSRLLEAPIRSWINMTLEAAKGASEYEQKLQEFGYDTVGLLPWDKGAKEVLEKDLMDAGIKLRVHRNRLLDDWIKIIDDVDDIASRIGVSSAAFAGRSTATKEEPSIAFEFSAVKYKDTPASASAPAQNSAAAVVIAPPQPKDSTYSQAETLFEQPSALNSGAASTADDSAKTAFDQSTLPFRYLVFGELIRTVARPLVLDYFEHAWDAEFTQFNFACKGCKRPHVFSELGATCLATVLDDAVDVNNEVESLKRIGTGDRGRQIFRTDVGSISKLSGLFLGYNIRSNVSINAIVNGRNAHAHKDIMSITEINYHIKEVDLAIRQLSGSGRYAAAEQKANLARLTRCHEAIAPVEIEGLVIQQLMEQANYSRPDFALLQESERERLRCSDAVAKLLTDEYVNRVLVIPPFTAKSYTQEMSKLQYLEKLNWKCVLDFNHRKEAKDADKNVWEQKPEYENVATFEVDDLRARLFDFVSKKYKVFFPLSSNVVSRLPFGDMFLIAAQTPVFPLEYLSDSATTSLNFLDTIRGGSGVQISSIEVLRNDMKSNVQHSSYLQRKVEELNGAVSLSVPGGPLELRIVRPIDYAPWGEFLQYADGEILTSRCDTINLPTDDNSEGIVSVESIVHDEVGKYLRGERPHWALFHDRHRKIIFRPEAEELSHILTEKTYVMLEYVTGTGGSTAARLALYQLYKMGFLCIVVTKFNDRAKVEDFVSMLKKFHRQSENQIIVLLDCNKEADSIREHLLDKLASVSRFCRVMECIQKDNGPVKQRNHSVVELKSHFGPELQQMYREWFPSRSKVFNKIVSHLVGQNIAVSPEYIVNESLNVAEIFKFLRSNFDTSTWQYQLRQKANTDPYDLLQMGLTKLEVLELGEDSKDILSKVDSDNGTPLFHFGLLCMDPAYEERVTKTIQGIVRIMPSEDLSLLRFLVFCDLFAPGVLISFGFCRLITGKQKPSLFVSQLVRVAKLKSNVRSDLYGDNANVLSIGNCKLAQILASCDNIFGNPNTKMFKEKLVTYLHGPFSEFVIKGCCKSFEFLQHSMLEILYVSFCKFNLWHWLPYPITKDRDRLSFSFLIELLSREYKRESAATLFESVATLAMDRCLFGTSADFAKLSEKHQKKVAKWSVSLMTNSCRLMERHATTGDIGIQRSNAILDRGLSLLDRIPSGFKFRENASGTRGAGFQDHEEVFLRRGVVYRQHMRNALKEYLAQEEVITVPEVVVTNFVKSLTQFDTAIWNTFKSWTHPLVSSVQLQLDLALDLQAKFKVTGRMNNLCDSLRIHGDELVPFFTHPTIENCVQKLKEARAASKYIRVDADRDRTDEKIEKQLQRLSEMFGSELPRDNVQLVLLRVKAKDHQSLSELLRLLEQAGQIVVDSHKARGDPNDVLAKAGCALTDVLELSTAIAARVSDFNGNVTSCPQLQVDAERKSLFEFRKSSKIMSDLLGCNPGVIHGFSLQVINVMICIHHTLTEGKRDNLLEKHDQYNVTNAVNLLIDKSTGYRDRHPTRFYVAKNAAVPNVPLTAFIAVDSSSILVEAREKANKEFYEAIAKQGNVREFVGEVQGTEIPTVSCPELNVLEIPFTVKQNTNLFSREKEPHLEAGTRVKFVIGIRYKGLRAHGVTPI